MFVSRIEDWLNCTTHESTGFMPYELIKGICPQRILEHLFSYPSEGNTIGVGVKLRLANENLLTKGERKTGSTTPKVSGLNMKWLNWYWSRHDLSNPQEKEIKKFFLLYEGPHEINQIKMDNAYVLSLIHI